MNRRTPQELKIVGHKVEIAVSVASPEKEPLIAIGIDGPPPDLPSPRITGYVVPIEKNPDRFIRNVFLQGMRAQQALDVRARARLVKAAKARPVQPVMPGRLLPALPVAVITRARKAQK